MVVKDIVLILLMYCTRAYSRSLINSIIVDGLVTNSSTFSIKDSTISLASLDNLQLNEKVNNVKVAMSPPMFSPIAADVPEIPQTGSQIKPQDISCNFEEGFCGWRYRNGWKLGRKKFEGSDKLGAYAYVDNSRIESQTSDILSPQVIADGQEYCFMCQLYVRLDMNDKLFFGITDGESAEGKTIHGDLGNKWTQWELTFSPASKIRVVFQAGHGKAEDFGKLALADFKFRAGPCKSS